MDDNNLFVSLLLELSQLRSEGFVADANGVAENFGLDRPEITAIVYVSDERAGQDDRADLFRLEVGGKADEAGRHRYARLNGEGPVFLVPGRLAEALARSYE